MKISHIYRSLSPILFLLGFGLQLFLGGDISGQNLDGIPVTQWVDPEGRKPITYQEWRERVGEDKPFQVETIYQTPQKTGGKVLEKFSVIVNSNLYPQIQSAVDQYVIDLEEDGYEVRLHLTSGGTPQNFRTFLWNEYGLGMKGCVLIGDLPVPWYEMDYWGYESFPIDLYYMDLDGNFGDSDHDGLFDSHTGDVGPEIYLGRLTASTLHLDGATEVSLVNRYFYKNHEHRTGGLNLNNRALVYVDDDWYPWAETWNANVGLAYSDRTLVKDPSTTRDIDYEMRLTQNYESILICAHSSPALHAFQIPSGWDGYTYNYEVKNIDPLAFFYNLFACSNARFVENDYMGGWYIFCQDYGLGAVGSTKTGAMLEFQDFYGPLSERRNFGEAFMDWFESQAAGGFSPDEAAWFYGMTYLGDPTLSIWSPLTLNLTPDSHSVPRGGTLGFTALLTNNSDNTQTVDAWTEVTLPDGSSREVLSPRTVSLAPHETITRHLNHRVPNNAPLGEYIYCGKVGTYPTPVIDEECFNFTVTP